MRSSSRNGSITESEATYHDAPTDSDPVPVAHEDRADAFDYHNFFLHSTMGRSNKTKKITTTSSSSSSDSASDASDDTARGPIAVNPERFPMLDGTASPKTPEMLRRIEQQRRAGLPPHLLHTRQPSNAGSVSSVSVLSFATATEGLRSGRQSPEKRNGVGGVVKKDGSDGADSGVALGGTRGGNSLANNNHTTSGATQPPDPFHKRQQASRHEVRTPEADPAAVAVHALTEPGRRPVGLKDKALIFMLVESVRNMCGRLQDEGLDAVEALVLRRRLEEARRVLEGVSPVVT